MNPSEVYLELYGRLPELVRGAVEGLSAEQLVTAPPGATNHVAWLVWHTARVLDHQLCEVRDERQVWEEGGWPARFGDVDPDPDNHGYGHTPEQVAGVRPDGVDALLDYFGAVWERTATYLAQLTPEELDRVVDEQWDPPVTLGVRLVSVADDALQHAGQAAYVRGMVLG